MRNNYQSKKHKSDRNFEVVRVQEELLVRVPSPMTEVWAEMQAQVEELTNFDWGSLKSALVAESAPSTHCRR